MLDSIRAFVAHVWSWCLASPANAVFALAVLGFVANVATRFLTSKEWAAWCEKHPRVVGLFLIAKGAFPEGGTIARGFWAAVTGELRQRAREALPKTEEKPKGPPTIPPVLGAFMMLLAISLAGCGGRLPPVARIVVDAGCVATHYEELADAEQAGAGAFLLTVERVARECGVERDVLVTIFGTHKQGRARAAMQPPAPACSSAALATPVRP